MISSKFNTANKSTGKSPVLSAQMFTATQTGSVPSNQSFNTSVHCSNNNNNNNSSLNNANGNVKFSGMFKEKTDDREKYLTAKYPNHQMALIKKRLKVEFWIDERLKVLFQIKEDDTKEDYEICPDDLVDTLLDIDSDEDRSLEVIVRRMKFM